ncbi:hypothetical protein ACFXPI_30160 [Streptomyces sp. NPDC059104]|uniref:hypothetical protein n=1 Tax=Streptomyces sp. NPDC059104 TaxID=3346729 RepID=UPI00368896F3
MAMGQKAAGETEPEGSGGRKLDLSVTQIAGSSLATVAAALLASKLGVYGTILGAGVVSVVATAGGPVIQHVFRRTGDQLRVSARAGADRVRPAAAEGAPGPSGFTEEFGEATVHGTRVRGWKRTAVASGAAFALAIGGLGTYEALAGTSISSDGGTLLSGGSRKAPDHRPAPPEDGRDGGGAGERGGKDGKTPGTGPSPDPSASRGSGGHGTGGTPSGSPTPPAPDPSASPAATPSKSATPPGPTPGTGGTGTGSGTGGGTGSGTGQGADGAERQGGGTP